MARCGVFRLDETLRVVIDLAGEAGAGEAGLAAAPGLQLHAEVLAEQSVKEGGDGGEEEPVAWEAHGATDQDNIRHGGILTQS